MKEPLTITHPDLAIEWHPLKNGDLTANEVTAGSDLKVWWRCSANPSHEWMATVCNRKNGTGCPVCAGKLVTPTTSLQTLYPELAAEWHFEKNGSFTPDMVVPGNHKKIWWRCGVDPSHEWAAVIRSRVKGSGCPMCKGKVATPTTSLRALYPELAKEWHLTKNGDLTSDMVRPGSNKKVWWHC